jgi:nucleotide-binding universal stress UspA family protein
MSATVLLAIIFAAWLGMGMAFGLVMGRRGHATFAWGVLGATLGPLVVPIAIAARRRPQSLPRTLITASRRGTGIDLLIGVDGSRAAVIAAEHALTLLHGAMRRATVATVVPYDAVAGETSTMNEAALSAARHFTEMIGRRVGVTVLEGRPALALADFARRGHYDVVAIGAKGSGLTELVLGSVARSLPDLSPVPVLVCPTTPRRRTWLSHPRHTRPALTPASMSR